MCYNIDETDWTGARMALQQKKRKVSFGIPEFIAAVLLAMTILTGIVWRAGQGTANWRETVGTLVRAAYSGQGHLFGAFGPDVELRYRYAVDGQVYQGQEILGPMGKTLIRLLPGTPEMAMSPQGYVGLDDLPPDFRRLLESRGVVSFDRVPESFLESLKAKGYTAVKDMPPAFKSALQKEDYATAAKMLDEVLPGSKAADAPPVEASGKTEIEKPASVEAASPGVINSVGEGLKVKYHPLYPFLSHVAFLPALGAVVSLGPFVFCSVLSVLYCAWGYPRVKRLVRH